MTNYLLQVATKTFTVLKVLLEKLIKDIPSKSMAIDIAKMKRNKFAERFDEFRAYPARGSNYIDLTESVFKKQKNFL